MNVIHRDVLLRKPTHDTTDSYETHDFVCLKETKQLQKKKIIFAIFRFQYHYRKFVYVFFPLLYAGLLQ